MKFFIAALIGLSSLASVAQTAVYSNGSQTFVATESEDGSLAVASLPQPPCGPGEYYPCLPPVPAKPAYVPCGPGELFPCLGITKIEEELTTLGFERVD